MNQKPSLRARSKALGAEVRFLPKSLAAGPSRPGPVPVSRLSELLVRVVRHSADQEKLVNSLRHMALTDELTGLYSRRGFMVLANQQMKLARRMKQKALLVFCDLDGLKEINDTFGHREGDEALRKIAKALRRTFRDSDVIARIGGDEFTVLALESAEHNEAHIQARLCDNIRKVNGSETRYSLSLSVGMVRSTLERSTSLEELMSCADEAMYARKRKKLKLVSSA